MGGTALGILGTLPEFHRHTKVVSGVLQIPNKQYLMRNLKLLAFVDAVLISAKSSGETDGFVLTLKASLCRKKDDLLY